MPKKKPSGRWDSAFLTTTVSFREGGQSSSDSLPYTPTQMNLTNIMWRKSKPDTKKYILHVSISIVLKTRQTNCVRSQDSGCIWGRREERLEEVTERLGGAYIVVVHTMAIH